MRMTRSVPLLGALLALSSPLLAQEMAAASQLHGLLERSWQFQLAENPLLASRVGDRRYDGRLGRVGVTEEKRRVRATRDFLAELAKIDAGALAGQDLISYEMFDRQLRDAIGDFEHRDYYLPLTVDSGFHTSFASLPRFAPRRTVADYESYISRLRAFSTLVDENVTLLREATSEGVSLPRVVLEGYEVTIETHVVDDVERSVFFAPFASYLPSIPEEERLRLTREGRAAIQEAAIPAYARFLSFFLDEYRPGARETLGASALPGGDAYYQHLIRRFTTLDLTADEVHEIGLGEVARIHKEMELVIEDVGFEEGFASFLEFLRTDPRFYVDTPEALLTQARSIAKRMDGRLPALFRTLPRQPYGVEPVPDHLAPKYTGGRYVGAPLDSTRGGTYWVNTYALPSRPLYTLEALTLHEAVPGHHLQNALRQELEGAARVPPLRRRGRLWRGLGPLLRTPRPRGRLLRRSLQQLRTSHVRDVARVSAGRGYGDPRPGLDARADDGVPGLEHGALPPRDPHGDGPLHLVARAGARVQARRAEDSRAPQARGRPARTEVRSARFPRRRSLERPRAAARAGATRRRVDRKG